MNATQEAAVAHYLGKGLSKDVAAGVAAVFTAESSLNPGSQGAQATEHGGVLNPAGAFGIASWNGPRQQALADFAARKGLNPAELNTQLDFFLTEAANGYPKTWAAIRDPATTYAAMVTVMVEDYERPADPAAEIARALAFAKDFMAATIEPLPAPAPAPAPVPVPAPPATGPPRQYLVVAEIAAAIMDVLNKNGVTLA